MLHTETAFSVTERDATKVIAGKGNVTGKR